MRYTTLLAIFSIAMLLQGCMEVAKTDFARRRANVAYMKNLDYAAAVPLYKEAIAQNDSEANYRMGMMIIEGATPGTTKQGIEYITRGADSGCVEAQSFLGRSMLYGQFGLGRDPVKAVDYLEKAAAKDDEAAVYALALAYSGIFNVKKDPARAAACYRHLADLGWDVPEAAKSESSFSKASARKLPTGTPGRFTTKMVQEHLNLLGYRVGKANGTLNSATRNAIRQFQKKAGRKEDGKPSIALVRDLHKALMMKNDPHL